MKASDIIKQLRAVAPRHTDKFSSTLSVTTLSRSGATVSVLSAGHGLVTGNYVTVKGAYEQNPVSIVSTDGVATVTTTNNHDLTEIGAYAGKVYDFNKAIITGAAETDYNGTFNVVSASNRKTFTYNVSGSPASPATGSPTLLQAAYNGRHQVTVTDVDNFTYTIATTPATPAVGTITAEKEARVSGALSPERALQGYTAQVDGELWAFVVVGDVTISKDRSIFSDATNTQSQQDEWRQRLIEPFSVFVFIPATSSISARITRDEIEDIRPILYKSLLGVKFPTTLTDETWSMVTADGDRYAGEVSNGAAYVHEFRFERVVDLVYADTVQDEDTKAFRDFNIDSLFDEGTGRIDSDIDLDDIPL